MKRMVIRALMAGGLACLSSLAHAEQGDTTTVYITGTLVDGPECTVNSNDQVNVHFGDDLITYQVDGVKYKKEILYTLTCNSLSQQGLTMSINGTTASFNSNLIKTDKDGLGIRLINGTEAITPGSAIKFNYGNQPTLFAVPVAQNPSTLGTGLFTGTATMVIAYQ